MLDIRPWPKACGLNPYGSIINDIRKSFGFFDPLPALSALGTDLYKKIHATSLISPLFHDPLPLLCGHHIWTLPNRGKQSEVVSTIEEECHPVEVSIVKLGAD